MKDFLLELIAAVEKENTELEALVARPLTLMGLHLQFMPEPDVIVVREKA